MDQFLKVELSDLSVLKRPSIRIFLRLELFRPHWGKAKLVAALCLGRGLFGDLLLCRKGGFGTFAAQLEKVELVWDFHVGDGWLVGVIYYFEVFKLVM